MKSVPDTTLVFATMDRPHAVQRFIYSIRAHYPELPVCVADQTEPTAYMREFYERQRVDVLWVPHDTGVGACRNLLVEKTNTPLVFMCDDDLVFTKDTDFTACLEILKHDPEVGIIGGQWLDKYGDWPETVRPWAIFLDLDRKRKTLTGIPAYHYFPQVRHVGVHKYYLCDTALNFSFLRRDVFKGENVRWDNRFKCNGEHEDFYLNFKTASDYLVAFYPGLVCRHRRPPAPAYERLRERAEGWRLFMEKWGVEQYCELDNGTRSILAPGTAHRSRNWGDYYASVGLSPQQEREDSKYPISLTDDMQVILAAHFDRNTGAPVRSRRSTASLGVDASGRLVARGGEPDGEDAGAGRTRALRALERLRANVRVRFRGPAQVRAGSEVFLYVDVTNTGTAPIEVGADSLFEGAFSCSFKRDGAVVAIQDAATPCFADIPPGVHQQLVRVQAPTVPGNYELAVRLTAGGALSLGEAATTALNVIERASPLSAEVPLESPQVDSGVPASQVEPERLSAGARLDWIRSHVHLRPLQRLDAAGRSALLVFTLDLGGGPDTELLLTHHWKKAGEYLAWDVRRQRLSGLRPGHQVQALIVERSLDDQVEIEVAAVVPDAGYVPLFVAPRPSGAGAGSSAELRDGAPERMLVLA